MIYVHIPFCRSFCTYCGFYSEAAPRGGKLEGCFAAYADNVRKEARERVEEIEKTLEVNTLYVGGGTPSVLPLSVLESIVGDLPYGPYDEFTVEVNPDDIVGKGEEYVRGLRSMGAGRLSMGVQSFDDGILSWMNRRHDAAGAEEAFRTARSGGFWNISLDLIFGISGMGDDVWSASVAKVAAMRPEHISAYQLSVEDGSALAGMVARGQYREAADEDCRRQYDILCRMLADAGYVHYEVSNFALPGYEAVHNSAYWRRVPYVGLGAGAHSFDGSRRSWNSPHVPTYSSESEVLTPQDERVERIMLGLRTASGLSLDWLEGNTAPGTVVRLLEEGALSTEGERIRIPEDHFFVSDEIIRELV